jgi:protein subunit release factor B
MPRFPVSPEKQLDLEKRMQRLGLLENQIIEQFVRASGPGGQKVNKTSSGVVLTHAPSGHQIKATESRSQGLNRFLARRRLVEILEAGGSDSKEKDAISRIRRKKNKSKRRQTKKLATLGDMENNLSPNLTSGI